MDIKKFAVSLAFILVAFFVVDRLGGMVCWQVNQHSGDQSSSKIKHLVEGVDEDVLLMGNSRCRFHYAAQIIGDSLGTSVYNGGIDAIGNIYSHYILLNFVLDDSTAHRPRVVCLELGNKDYETENDPFDRAAYFAPYIGRNERVDSVYRLAGTYWLYQLSHLYRYNSKLVSNLLGLVKNTHENDVMGFSPLERSSNRVALKAAKSGVTDSMKLEYVQRYIELCRQKGVEIIFTISPRYKTIPDGYYDALHRMADDNNVPMLDYHTEGLFLDRPNYFKDESHLCGHGAEEFSQLFAADVRDVLVERGVLDR